MAQIKLTKLTKVINGTVLFTAPTLVASGSDVVGVIGRNGAGKTTLMKIIAGQDHDFSGQRVVSGSVQLVKQVNELNNDRSGGQETLAHVRVALAGQPAILILDEPTANLDEPHQEWLINQLRHFNGLTVVVSHDDHFLREVTTKMWVVRQNQYEQFDGPLTSFEQADTRLRDNQAHSYERQRRQQRELKQAAQERKQRAQQIRRGSRKMGRVELAKTKSAREQNAGKMERNAHAMKARAEHQVVTEKPFEERSVKIMSTDFPLFKGKTVTSANDLTLVRSQKTLLKHVTFQIKPGQRVALSGPNGSGKSSLIEALLHHQKRTNLSADAQVGYFNQDITTLPNDLTVWQLMKRASVLDQNRTRQMMGAFGLDAQFYDRLIDQLSGGERVRLQLLAVLLSASNFLILDEPTNFLDRDALKALAAFLNQYPGAVLFVSHDAEFRDKVANETLELRDQRLVDPARVVLKATRPTNLPLLQLEYDRLMASPDASTQRLTELKQQIDALKK